MTVGVLHAIADVNLAIPTDSVIVNSDDMTWSLLLRRFCGRGSVGL
jgi:DNA-binding LacI/PurR family transcriptional regulator